MKNLQGDIIGLVDESGNTVVEYKYDSWGNLLNKDDIAEGSVGAKNPFRYRGYYYDTETGMYYLESRYYDPEIRRFINADSYVSTGLGTLEKNMYVYCLNNVIKYRDSTGRACSCVYDGTAADFRRLEEGLPPIKCKHIDITEKLDKALKENAEILRTVKKRYGNVIASVYFFAKVKTNGDWDFKNQSEWNLKPDKEYYWHGQKMRHDDIGNFHFGYVGKEVFSTTELLLGAGVAQLCSDVKNYKKTNWSIETNFDDSQDQRMVEAGCVLWDYGF